MKNRLFSLLLCGSVFAADHQTEAPIAPVAPEPTRAGRTVMYADHDVIPVRAQLRFTTLIVLPKSEQIMDFVCGDKEYWVVNGAQNFAYVKPSKEHARTNLNLVTASGNVYSFTLEEGAGAADLKLFVELRDESMISALSGTPRFVPAAQLEDYRAQVEIAQTQAREAKKAAQAAIESQAGTFAAEYPGKMKHPYKFERDKKPFLVSAIFHDDKFTYIQASPEETPALYEMKDGKPNLINFQFKDGTYMVDKILDSGYLAIGKQKLGFYK